MSRWAAGCALLCACITEDAGGHLIDFHAYASGVEDVRAPFEFDTVAGYHVSLESAHLHIGAVYMRLGAVNAGDASSSCYGDTTYGLEVPGPVDVDLLVASPQEFSVPGRATSDLNQSAELWLTGGDINTVTDNTAIVTVAGHVRGAALDAPFHGAITISNNRAVQPSNPAVPGANPICKQRIVAPIPVSLRPALGGNLWLRIDPRPWFADLDFAALSMPADDLTLSIPDTSSGSGGDAAQGRTFFLAVTAASAESYRFSWISP